MVRWSRLADKRTTAPCSSAGSRVNLGNFSVMVARLNARLAYALIFPVRPTVTVNALLCSHAIPKVIRSVEPEVDYRENSNV